LLYYYCKEKNHNIITKETQPWHVCKGTRNILQMHGTNHFMIARERSSIMIKGTSAIVQPTVAYESIFANPGSRLNLGKCRDWPWGGEPV